MSTAGDGSPARDRDSHPAPEDALIPDPSRLRLDTLLQQLVERAGELIDNERRVHRLLDSVVAITRNLTIPEVLQSTVDCSRQIVGAGYSSLGVIGPDRTIVDFYHSGLSPEDVHEIGHFPSGKGILGVLIDEPAPLRIRDLREHPGAIGFPRGHPQMGSFLGMPIRVRDEVYANLYLIGKQENEEFTLEDEQLIIALAAAAAMAIENANMYEEIKLREAWLEMSEELTSLLLGGASAQDMFDLITQRVLGVGRATTALLAFTATGEPLPVDQSDSVLPAEEVLPADEPWLAATDPSAALTDGIEELPSAAPVHVIVRSAAGMYADRLLHEGLIAGGTVIGTVLRTAKSAIQTGGLDELGWPESDLTTTLGNGTALILPVTSGTRPTGVLVVCRPEGHVPFDWSDLQLADRFSRHIALALHYVRAQANVTRLAIFEDRDRIARDLHDQVIQRMFAVGLGLEGVVRRVPDSDISERVRSYIGTIDDTIHELRRAIFSLREDSPARSNLGRNLIDIADEFSASLGFPPRLTLEGPLEAIVPDIIRPELLAAFREALSNVARHAHATIVSARVAVDTEHDRISLTVQDNGIGMPPSDRVNQSGLANLAERASRLSGNLRIGAPSGGGTRLEWSVPLTPPTPADEPSGEDPGTRPTGDPSN